MLRLARRPLSSLAALAAAEPVDILVVGGGVVGSAFAARAAEALANHRVVVVDGGGAPPPLSSYASATTPDLRTFAITPSTADFFGPTVWGAMLAARATPFTSMQVGVPERPRSRFVAYSFWDTRVRSGAPRRAPPRPHSDAGMFCRPWFWGVVRVTLCVCPRGFADC